MKYLFIISSILAGIGAVNWGLIGFFDKNLVTMIFGENALMTNIVYRLVGLSGIYLLFNTLISSNKPVITE